MNQESETRNIAENTDNNINEGGVFAAPPTGDPAPVGATATTASGNAQPPKKEGLGSRILHSKDSTKLIASLAFCLAFAVGTILVVNVFDGPDRFDHRDGMRMEQRGGFGYAPDMGLHDRHGYGNGSKDMDDGRNFDENLDGQDENIPEQDAQGENGDQPENPSNTEDNSANNSPNGTDAYKYGHKHSHGYHEGSPSNAQGNNSNNVKATYTA